MTLLHCADGRKLDIRVTGPDGGVPLLFHHGTPGSLVPSRGLERAAHARGLRFVTWSRPGYGDSSRRPGRSVADVADDVAALLDDLCAPRCLVMGKSGGGPHALATAALLPEQVAAVASVAGVGPYGVADLDWLAGMGAQNVEEFTLTLSGDEPALRAFLEREADGVRDVDPPTIVRSLHTLLPEVDRAVLTDEYGEDTVANFSEALRTGVDGWFDDDHAFARPWGFEVSAVEVPAFVWQGDADLMVPFAHGQWLAEHVPGAVAHLEPEQGHLSITVGAADRMLDELIACL